MKYIVKTEDGKLLGFTSPRDVKTFCAHHNAVDITSTVLDGGKILRKGIMCYTFFSESESEDFSEMKSSGFELAGREPAVYVSLRQDTSYTVDVVLAEGYSSAEISRMAELCYLRACRKWQANTKEDVNIKYVF